MAEASVIQKTQKIMTLGGRSTGFTPWKMNILNTKVMEVDGSDDVPFQVAG